MTTIPPPDEITDEITHEHFGRIGTDWDGTRFIVVTDSLGSLETVVLPPSVNAGKRMDITWLEYPVSWETPG